MYGRIPYLLRLTIDFKEAIAPEKAVNFEKTGNLEKRSDFEKAGNLEKASDSRPKDRI
ncbi:MAG: hypothetical protein HDR80_04065 [Bacteroides sp.]|nr:hypothetical protein [Bacteroides sp.]